MGCNVKEALMDIEELATKSGVPKELKVGLNKILNNPELLKSMWTKVSETTEEATRSAYAKVEVREDVKNKLDGKDKLYSELVYTNHKGGNPLYINSMINLLNKVSPAKIKEVRLILSEQSKLMAGSYKLKTNIIEVLKNPSKRDIAISIRNTLQEHFAANGTLSDALLDQLYDKQTLEAFELNAEETIKELEGIKGKEVLLHEYVHSVTQKFMLENPKHPAVLRMKKLYNMAKRKKSKIDDLMINKHMGMDYWIKDEFEFVSEGLSNPDFMLALLKIEVPGMEKLSVFEEFIQTIVEMLGFQKNKENMYSLLLDSTLAMAYEQGNRDILDSAVVEEFGKIKEQQKQDNSTLTTNEIVEQVLECAKG